MRAVIIATGQHPELGSLESGQPSPLIKIADKPILFHVIEWCILQGLQHLDIVLHHFPEMIRDKVGDGSRWGVDITYHTARTADRPYGVLRPLARSWEDRCVLLGMGDRLPGSSVPVCEQNTLFLDEQNEWTGWAAVHPTVLASLPQQCKRRDLPSLLDKAERYTCSGRTVSTLSIAQVSEANALFLLGQCSNLQPPTSAREVETGVWLSSSCQIHPSARVNAPVFIGRNTQIEAGVRLGPNAVVENNCIVDKGTSICNALVCQNSYVGEGLDIHDSVLNRKWILHTEHGMEIPITDDIIACELDTIDVRSRFFQTIERLAAGTALLGLTPIWLPLFACCQITSQPVLQLPTSPDHHRWHTFALYSFRPYTRRRLIPKWLLKLPHLWNILRGEMHFVGLRPRSLDEVEQMPYDWRSLYITSKVGWLNPEDVELNDPHPTHDERYVTEVFYAAHDSPSHDVKLVGRYIAKVLKSLSRS